MKLRYLLYTLLLVFATGCHEIEDYENDPYGNFDCLWDVVDRNYCYFEEKGIDWNAIGEDYRSRIIPGITRDELFALCSQMLAELQDGHVNLISAFDISYYRRWWTDYPQDFDYRVVQQYYLDFDYHTIGSIDYKILPQNIGYIRYPSFSYGVGAGNLDYVLSYLAVCDALIIDIRNNGGGLLTNIEPFVGRLIHERICGGYIRHKTSPAHDSFSDWYPIDYEPAKTGNMPWNKPIAILTNRSTFSAANTFAAVMKQLPGVYIVGAQTGGGGGLPFTADLPNGWRVRFSASPVADADYNSIEEGIAPTAGCEVHATPERLALGIDDILEKAIAILSNI